MPARTADRGRRPDAAVDLALRRVSAAGAIGAAAATAAAGAAAKLGVEGTAAVAAGGVATTGAGASAGGDVEAFAPFEAFAFGALDPSAGVSVFVAAAASCPAPPSISNVCKRAAAARTSDFFIWPGATRSPGPAARPPCFASPDFADAGGATHCSAAAASSTASAARAHDGKLWGGLPMRALGRSDLIAS